MMESATAGPSKPRLSHTDLHHLSPEIIIIGAGIAGSALSYSLSKTGRNVLLLERDLSEPDRIVGELLQPGGVAALNKLGMGDCLEGIDATPVEGYAVITDGRMVGVPYPALEAMAGDEVKRTGREDWEVKSDKALENGHSHVNGHATGHAQDLDGSKGRPWHVESLSGTKEGRSFHHGRLISSLRRKCIEDSDVTVLEATVRDLIYCEHTDRVIGVTAAFKIAKPTPPTSPTTETVIETPAMEYETVVKNIYAPLTIIADGCFSKFRTTRGAKLPTPKTRSHFVGVIVHDQDLPLPRHGTVCLTPSGPVLLYQIGYKARETRMLVDVKGKLPSVADGSLKNFLLEKYVPFLPESLQGAVTKAITTQRLRTMPNSFLPPSMQGRPSQSLSGAIMVGDAYNMRHPLTGGGMTVAFNDAVILTRMLRPGGDMGLSAGREGLEDWGKIAEGLRGWFWERKNLAGTVNVLSMALYDLFGGSEEEDLKVLREGCFRYFQLGGECVAGPVGFLSALAPKPLMLFYHFFCVAFYSIWILITQGRPPQPGEKAQSHSVLDVPVLMLLSVRVFWTACHVLLPVIWTEFKV